MFSWLAYNSLCALPLALVAVATGRWRRTTPTFEHFLWLLVLLRLVLPPLPGFAALETVTASNVIASSDRSLGNRIVAELTRALGTNWSTWAERGLLAGFLVLLAWVLVRELLRARAVERCVRRARRARAELEGHVHSVAQGLGVGSPRVFISPEASGPFLWSLRRPVLVLPEEDGMPSPTVLAHEFAHLRRRDHWTAWLELGVQALHFWNPLFWFARRRLHLAAELACDHWVVQRFPAERRTFASALIDTAERASTRSFVPRAVQAIGMDRRDFEERLVRILHGDTRTRTERGALALAALLALLTLPGWTMPTLAQFRGALPEIPRGIDAREWQDSLAEAERRLDAHPDDGAALKQRGMALLGLGRHDEAIQSFEWQAELGFEVPKALYNQACAHALAGEHERAIECLAHAAELGLDVQAYVSQDPDLVSVRDDPRLVGLPRR